MSSQYPPSIKLSELTDKVFLVTNKIVGFYGKFGGYSIVRIKIDGSERTVFVNDKTVIGRQIENIKVDRYYKQVKNVSKKTKNEYYIWIEVKDDKNLVQEL